jgi:hypothetical protein
MRTTKRSLDELAIAAGGIYMSTRYKLRAGIDIYILPFESVYAIAVEGGLLMLVARYEFHDASTV